MSTTDLRQTVATMGSVAAIASSSGRAQERAATIIEEFSAIVPHVACEIVSLNPLTGGSDVLATTGYSEDVLDNLHSEDFHDLMRILNLPYTGRPVRMKDLPGDPLDNWAVSDVLIPAGYSEGMTMCLHSSDGRFTGVLNLSTVSTEHPSDIARDAIASLCAALGNMADATQQGHWIQMLLGAGSMAIGLDATGETVSIPGVSGHRLLDGDSDLIRVAQKSAGQMAWNSFIWPDADDWFKVRIVPCKGEQAFSTVVSLDTIEVGPLSRRELEVLTLAADGLSNHEIGEALVISNRTVASHVEHILDKLGAPNRAAAASMALREGMILGQVDTPGRR